MAVVMIDINNFREYSKHLSLVLKIYIILIVIIGIFGGYKILTNYIPPIKMSIQNPPELEF